MSPSGGGGACDESGSLDLQRKRVEWFLLGSPLLWRRACLVGVKMVCMALRVIIFPVRFLPLPRERKKRTRERRYVV